MTSVPEEPDRENVRDHTVPVQSAAVPQSAVTG